MSKKVISMMDRAKDNSTWSLSEMLKHVRLSHSDKEINRAVLILHTKDGQMFTYLVNTNKPEVLWIMKLFEWQLLTET